MALRYEDGYQYQNILGPLVKMEADEDRSMKERQTKDDVTVRWEEGLSKRHLAHFRFFNPDAGVRHVVGDEIRLRAPSASGKPWEGTGTVLRIEEDEVTLQMRGGADPPEDLTGGYTAEMVWKSVSFDRMQAAMRTFAVDDTSVSGYLYHSLLGHQVAPQTVRTSLPRKFSAPSLPELNHSQVRPTQPATLAQRCFVYTNTLSSS